VPIWLDFLSRKVRLQLRRLAHLGEYVELHGDANVRLSASIEAGGGAIRLKKHCLIDVGVILRAYGGIIEIGECSTVGPYSALYGGGKLVIGDYVKIGPQVKIFASNHTFKDRKTRIVDQGMDYKGICIEDDVWIGAGACILDGVTLHKGSVIAAGAVVTESTEAYSIAAGVPARIIGRRTLS
jgi:acetyltransferase-like isoleucine patch superfamily enzyme